MSEVRIRQSKKGILQMEPSHTRRVVSATFDEPNLVSAAGLVLLMRLAASADLSELAGERVSVPTDKGANPGLKLSSLVGGMAAGADSIDDMAQLTGFPEAIEVTWDPYLQS